MGIHSVRGFGIVWVSALHEIISNLIILACHVCFSSTYSVLWDFTHPMIWEFLYLFLFQIFKKLLNFECFCFPYFVLTMGVCFSHVLGIVWINSKKIWVFPSISHEVEKSIFNCFQKPTGLERSGCSQNISMLWEIIHSQTPRVS